MRASHPTIGHALPWARLARLAAGTVLIGLGISLLVRARLGLMPIDVAHQGAANALGSSLGTGIIVTQAVLLATFLPLRIRPGIGTLAGFLVPAAVTDTITPLLPQLTTLAPRITALVAGGLCMCTGVALYLSANLGPMPRDGLMVGLGRARLTRVAAVRVLLDVAFVAIGTALIGPAAALHGGGIGPGTVVLMLACGPLIAALIPIMAHERGHVTRLPTTAGAPS